MVRFSGRAANRPRTGMARRAVLVACTVSILPLAGAFPQLPAAAAADPPWLLHAKQYPGGLSAGVRQVAFQIESGSPSFALPSGAGGSVSSPPSIGSNVQMNDDSDPPTPQNETSVAYDIFNPKTAVAAANDYASTGVVVMRTRDGGLHWVSTRIGPIGSSGACFGGDPWVVFSRRDRAFYVAQLCFAVDGSSEVHLVKSVDGGRTWTPAGFEATAASNVDPSTGEIDTSLFLDKEAVAVDNSRSSPHYGRIYVTYAKFHMLPSGFSDYCPIQVAYTDRIPTNHPFDAEFSHTAVVPDDPGDDGRGASANQDGYPVVERDGTLDVSYALEDCNTTKNRHVLLQKSSDGGESFLPEPIRIDRPGEFVDNPNLRDKLPPTRFRVPLSPTFAVNSETGDLAYAYMNDVNEARSGTDISIQFSSDGGYHWSSARVLSVTKDGAPAPEDQFFPAVSADPAGRWHAIWFDRRLDSDNLRIQTFQSDWTGTPSKFRNRRISTKSWNPNRGFFGCGCFIGDYNGIASANSVIYATWTDGRHSAYRRTGIGETDIFTNVEIRS